VQRNFAAHWRSIAPETATVDVVASVEETVRRVREEGAAESVFVTGGVHVVGGFLAVLG
jgi:dihydrofolate reductase